MEDDPSLILQKMIFIYNALLKGWTVKMLEDNKFEFLKDNESIKKEVDLSDYLRKFIQYNLNIDNLR
jgi:hypothetical protein